MNQPKRKGSLCQLLVPRELGVTLTLSFPEGSDGKESACNARDPGSFPGWEKIPWRRKRQPTPVFLPGESHGQRSLAGYSPLRHKESDMTE